MINAPWVMSTPLAPLRFARLLRGGSHQRRCLPSRLDEHWCGILQEEERAPRHSLSPAVVLFRAVALERILLTEGLATA